MCFDKYMRREPVKQNNILDVIVKVIFVLAAVAGIVALLKIAYDRYKKNTCCLCDGDDDGFCDDILEECSGCCEDCDIADCELNEDSANDGSEVKIGEEIPSDAE